jgi:hypothetical protein
MKKKLLLLVAALMAIGQNAFAYDFSAVAPSGQTLYYKIIDSVNHYVKITCPQDTLSNNEQWSIMNSGRPLWNNDSLPAGALTIPSTVLHDGITYTVRAIGAYTFARCPIYSVVMSNTIDSLADCAFFGCDFLTNVTFSNTLRYIGGSAFEGAYLGNVVLPPSVRILKEAALISAHITSITLSDSLEVMGELCLDGNAFTSLYLPASVRYIHPRVYLRGLSELSSIAVDPNNPYFDSRDNCNAIINSVTNELLLACRNTIIPEGVYIFSSGAYASCPDVIVLPTTVMRLNYTSYDPVHIKHLVINSPSIIGYFDRANSLDTIQVLSTTPPSLLLVSNPEAFDFNRTVVIVPCNSLQAYQTASGWSYFTNMQELGTPQITVNAEHGTATVDAYPSCGNDTATVSATTEEEHYHFVRWSDGSTQNPYTLVLTGNTTLTAIFAIDSVLVRATPANPLKGAVMGGGVVPLNGTTTLTAIPSGSNIFLTWSNGVTDNPYTLTATSDTTLQAYFTLPDTLIFRDTINHYIHDTTFINNYVHDTTIQYMNQYVHDTTYINNYVHDTTILYMNQYVHDTTYINNYIHDTVRMTTQMFDTTIVNVYHFDTAIYNTYHFDTLIVNNHYYDTVYITTHHYDTIYITEQGIGDVDGINAKVYSSNGQVVVEGANGNMVTLYDVTGRVLDAKQDDYAPMRFDAPATGTYMIKIGAYPARKVVVIR